MFRNILSCYMIELIPNETYLPSDTPEPVKSNTT